MKIVEWAFFLILVYILVSNWGGTVPILKTAGAAVPPVLQSLQGVGPGYPPPARG